MCSSFDDQDAISQKTTGSYLWSDRECDMKLVISEQ
jgi:hypothetical protein